MAPANTQPLAEGHAADADESTDIRRSVPCVLLVRIEEGEDPPELRLREQPLLVLRVRHPLPACVRIRVVHPHVVVVGRSVMPGFLPELFRAARAVKAELLDLSVTGRHELHDSLIAGIRASLARRAKPSAP